MQRLLHKRLTKSLLLEISRGEHANETRFLSNRNIRRLWGISQGTVDRSMAYLKEQQVIVALERSAYQLTPGARERAMFLIHYSDDKPLPKVFQAKTQTRKPPCLPRRRCALIIEGERCWVKWRADHDEHSQDSLPILQPSSAVPDLCNGFLSEARQLGHHVDIILIPKDQDCRHFLQSCIQKAHWDGVAFFRRIPDSRHEEVIQCFKNVGIPQITIMEPSEDRHVPCVEVNNFALGYEAATAMIQSGAKRFILLDIIEETYVRNARIKGALFALESKGLKDRCVIHRMSHLPDKAIQNDFEILLTKSRTIPTGLFVLYNQLLEKITPLIDQLQLRIPEHLSIINCSTPVRFPSRDLQLPFVEINFREIGATAYHSLSHFIDGYRIKKYTIVEPTFRDGGSTPEIS